MNSSLTLFTVLLRLPALLCGRGRRGRVRRVNSRTIEGLDLLVETSSDVRLREDPRKDLGDHAVSRGADVYATVRDREVFEKFGEAVTGRLGPVGRDDKDGLVEFRVAILVVVANGVLQRGMGRPVSRALDETRKESRKRR